MSVQDPVCREFVEVVTDYLEGRLPPAEREGLERHLAGCPGCTAYLEQMRATITLSGRLAVDELAPEARDELLGVYRAWRSGA